MAKKNNQGSPATSGDIEVVSLGGSFRRAGLSFGTVPVVIKAGDITQEQLEALQAEPALKVTDAVTAATEA